ncbi:hypothetical protein MO973_30940 [Paenibacillus sp. TRM 82003]|nr:hypothetical protein [Paenibacillus sp. TRM 82003]
MEERSSKAAAGAASYSSEAELELYRSVAFWFASGAAPGAERKAYRPPSPEAFFAYAKRAAAVLTDVVGRADATRAAARRLRLGGVFERKAARTSDAGAVTATATERAREAAYDIVVERTAAAQRHGGAPLPASATGGIPAGTQRVAITVGMRTAEAAFDVRPLDTNETALQRMREALRRADPGVQTALVRDPLAHTVRLQLTAAGTGTDFAFEVSDLEGSAAANAGLLAPSSPAVNARYRVNGGEKRTSSSNTIVLDSGRVLATLKRTGEAPVRLTVGPNDEEIAASIANLIETYNGLVRCMTSSPEFIDPEAVRNVAEASRQRGLDDIGGERLPDGGLALETDRFREVLAFRPEAIRRLFLGEDGLAGRVGALAERIVDAPTAQLLHPDAAKEQSYPIYAPGRGLSPSWVRMNGIFLNIKY